MRQFLSVVVIGLFTSACGYTAGLVAPEYSRTVGVAVLGNATPLRNLEVEMTSELTRSVTNLVPLALVPPDEADVVITGTITDYRRRSGVRDTFNVPLETAVSITIQASLVRRRTGEVIRTSVANLASGLIVEGGVIADDTPTEVDARKRAVANLADRLVLDLFRP